MYNGQIFALLGHNGAGKTSLINILTQNASTTTGGAVIYDKDINFDEDFMTPEVAPTSTDFIKMGNQPLRNPH